MPLFHTYQLRDGLEHPVENINDFINEMKRRMKAAKEIFEQQQDAIREKFNEKESAI